jgi:DNA primase
VASLGTAFTEAQAKLLGRFARKVVVNYDGDGAGVKAARRAIDTLLTEDFEIKVLVLPGGSDPDDFIRSQGVKAYREQRNDAAISYLTFVLEQAVRDKNLNVPKHKASAIDEIMPVLCAVRNPTEQRESFDDAMSVLRIEDTALREELWKAVRSGKRPDALDIKRQIARTRKVKEIMAEYKLLVLLVHDEELRKIILPTLEETDHEALASASLFHALIEADKRSLEITAENLSALLDEEDTAAHDMLPLLIMSEAPRGAGEPIDEILHEAEKYVLTLRSMAIQEHMLRMEQEQHYAEEKGYKETVDRLAAERVKLMRQKRELERMIKQH